MKAAFEVLRVVQLVVFGGLALLTIFRFMRRRGPAEAWLAGIFSILGGIVAIGFLISEEPTGSLADQLFRKSLLAVLLLFPYMLFRFATAMDPAPRLVTLISNGLTVAACLMPFALGPIPGPGAVRSMSWGSYAGLLVVQWLFTSVAAGTMLWRRGRGQPTVVRKRMRFLSLGTYGLAFGIVVSVTFGGGGEVTVSRVVTQLIGILCGPLFLLGASPPAAAVMLWRRPEVATMMSALRNLMSAESAEEIASGLLHPAMRVVGGRAGALIIDGSMVGMLGTSPSDEDELRARIASGSLTHDRIIEIPMTRGALYVVTSNYAPYLGMEEKQLLEGTAVLADLALQRVFSLERERRVAAEQREFLAIASHDLRTPLAVIRGYTGLMEGNWEGLSDDDKRTFNSTIDRQARHLSRLVNDLLLSSRLDANALHASATDVALRPAVEEALEGIEEDASRLRINIPDGIGVHVDPEHLMRMIVNLVNNAFAHGSPPVDVSAEHRGGMVEVRVRDHGSGISVGDRDRLFERFVQPRSSARATGTGLGLYIVHGLVTEARGRVAYEEPRFGDGACFVLSLPASETLVIPDPMHTEVAG